VNVWRYVKTSSGFADYSEHLTSMALIVALSPVFTSRHHLLITVNLQPPLADYSEPFTDCSERLSTTLISLLTTVNIPAILVASPLLFSLFKSIQSRNRLLNTVNLWAFEQDFSGSILNKKPG